QMNIRIAVTFAIGISISVITVSLIVVGVIFNDINNLYDDIIDEMKEFNVIMIIHFFQGKNDNSIRM
ncbi:hypothetical protein WUBG_13606, partial [Wuchereria bancrofti]